MSFILNMIREKVASAIQVDVQPAQYGKYPVTVKDISNSVTAGWTLVYRVDKSRYNDDLFSTTGRFAELHIPNFSQLYSHLQVVYSKFQNGEGVEQRYNTRFATYPMNDQLWFTALQRKNGVSITMTVIDQNSPFHMLTINFFVTISEHTNAPYLVGYDSCYDRNTDTFIDKYNSHMLPPKKRYIPIHKNGADAPSLIKAAGQGAQNGMVMIDENQTEIVYIQELNNERRMLAGIYERIIMEIAFEKAKELLANQAPAQAFGSFGGFQNQSWNQNWTANTAFGQASAWNQQQQQIQQQNQQQTQTAFNQQQTQTFNQQQMFNQQQGTFNQQQAVPAGFQDPFQTPMSEIPEPQVDDSNLPF